MRRLHCGRSTTSQAFLSARRCCETGCGAPELYAAHVSSAIAPGEAPAAPLRGELRYGLELARLLATRDFHRPRRGAGRGAPVLLIPGVMASDGSLALMASWLRRRGSPTTGAGMLVNADCAERAVVRLQARLRRHAE